jgi:hypothetical protein
MRKNNSFYKFAVIVFGFLAPFFSVCHGKQKLVAIPTVVITVSDSTGFFVPANFTGISFESDAALPNHRGVKGYFFSSQNKELVNLFINSGEGKRFCDVFDCSW